MSHNSKENGILFHFFPVTVAENSWKNQMSDNLCFQVGKRGVESRGTRRDPEGVEMGFTPAWDPPFSNEKTQNYANLGFSSVFSNVTGKKVKHRAFFNFKY